MNIREKFFERITRDFEVMAKTVILQAGQTRRLLDDNTCPDFYDDIQHTERIIDSLDVKMRNEVVHVIVLYSPKASDLRKLMSYYDMTAYLERIGDLLVNIAGFLHQIDLQGAIFPGFRDELSKLLATAENMTQNAIFAFTCEDNKLARETIELDDTVDTLHREIGRRLRDYGGRQLEEQQLTDILCLNSISYNIERIGDNATNIAEAAIYRIEGKNIRHRDLPGRDTLLAGSEG